MGRLITLKLIADMHLLLAFLGEIGLGGLLSELTFYGFLTNRSPLLPLILWRPVCFQFHDFEVYKRSGSYSSLTIHLLYNHALSLGLSFKFTEVREHWITWVRFFSVAVAESSHVRPYCVFLSLVVCLCCQQPEAMPFLAGGIKLAK